MQEFENAFAATGLKAGALQSSYAMAENVFAVTRRTSIALPAPRIWADGGQFRNSHRVVRVAEGSAGSVSFTSSGRLLPNHDPHRVRFGHSAPGK